MMRICKQCKNEMAVPRGTSRVWCLGERHIFWSDRVHFSVEGWSFRFHAVTLFDRLLKAVGLPDKPGCESCRYIPAE